LKTGVAHGKRSRARARHVREGPIGGEPLGLSLGISVFDDEAFAFDVAEISQSLQESGSDGDLAGQVDRQVADSRDPKSRLRLGGERHGEHGPAQHADECPPIHHSIT
jgi:hypothetical protein